MRPVRLTEVARQAVCDALCPGDLAIDATVGNGHDTRFLAETVAPDGKVLGLDVQQAALDATRVRLDAIWPSSRGSPVDLFRCGHEQLRRTVPPDWHGRVGAVMFNLGYLPGGDKTLITRRETTLAALDQALPLLRPGGLISLMVYRGHPGAQDEADAISQWALGLTGNFEVTHHDSPGPCLYLIERRC